MIQNIFIVLGFLNFIDAIFIKWNIWDEIAKDGSKQDPKSFVYKLSQCQFCLKFWISCFVTMTIGAFGTFEWSILAVPFICSGITHLIKK